MSGLPLGGVRVLELANWMAGPSAGAVLADLGADVIKVEPLGGDAVRGLMRQPKAPPGRASIDYSFTADNRGKRSVAVAIDRPEGADVVRRLTAGVDVFSCNLLHSAPAPLRARPVLALRRQRSVGARNVEWIRPRRA